MRKNSLSGKINVGCLFISIILIAGGYVGFKFGKVYLAKYMFNRKIIEIAGDVSKDPYGKIFTNERIIVETVKKAAREFSVDITHDDILINLDGKSVTIHVTWEGDVVIPTYTHHFIFHFESKRKIVY